MSQEEEYSCRLHCSQDIDNPMSWGMTPLQYAAAYDLIDDGKYILNRGANPNEIGGTNQPPLTHAIVWGNLEFVQMLIDFGADPMFEPENGRTPYSISEEVANPRNHGTVETLKLLTKYLGNGDFGVK